jgi:hypothetical protein
MWTDVLANAVTDLTNLGTCERKQAKLVLRKRVPNLYFLLKEVHRKHSTAKRRQSSALTQIGKKNRKKA